MSSKCKSHWQVPHGTRVTQPVATQYTEHSLDALPTFTVCLGVGVSPLEHVLLALACITLEYCFLAKCFYFAPIFLCLLVKFMVV